MRTEAIKKAQKKYEQTGVILRKTVKLHKTLDADIIDHVNSLPNFNSYIKDLIRKDKEQG